MAVKSTELMYTLWEYAFSLGVEEAEEDFSPVDIWEDISQKTQDCVNWATQSATMHFLNTSWPQLILNQVINRCCEYLWIVALALPPAFKIICAVVACCVFWPQICQWTTNAAAKIQSYYKRSKQQASPPNNETKQLSKTQQQTMQVQPTSNDKLKAAKLDQATTATQSQEITSAPIVNTAARTDKWTTVLESLREQSILRAIMGELSGKTEHGIFHRTIEEIKGLRASMSRSQSI